MARWLRLDDYIAIQQLQSRGIQLDLERAVLWPHSPLNAALAAHLPYLKIAAESIVLHSPMKHKRALGFLQARARRGRPEADISFIAPALDSEDAVAVWYRLLAECTHWLGEQRGQRLFAQVPEASGAENVFAQSGFSMYAREEIFRALRWPPNLKKTETLRHQRRRDGWTLLRLYAQLTPRGVQIAEGMLSSEGQAGKMGAWWDQSHGAGYLLEIENELVGAVRVQRGRGAYWLHFWLHPQADEHGSTLVRGALDLLWAAPRHPIYCNVREYESGLRFALEEAGFEFFQARSLLVKHTTVRAKEPLFKLVPALEKRPEPAASVPHHIK